MTKAGSRIPFGGPAVRSLRALSLVVAVVAVPALAQVPRSPQPANPDAMVLSLGDNHLIEAVFLQGGKLLATYGADGKLRLWDTDRGTPRGEAAQVGHPTNYHAFRFLEHPDGKRLVVAGAHVKATVLSLEDGKILHQIAVPYDNYPVSFALLDHGKTLARLDRTLNFRHYDVDSGKEKADVRNAAPPKGIEVDGGGRSRLVLAPDAKTYAVNDGKCVLRDAATHEARYTLRPDGKRTYTYRNGPYRPYYSADGGRVLFHGTDGTLRVVDVATGKELQTLRMEEADPRRPGVRRVIAPVAFAPNGQWVLATTEDQFGELVLYGVASGLEVRRFPPKVVGPTTASIALSPSPGNLLVVPGPAFHQVEVWEMDQSRIRPKAPAGK